MDTRLSGCDLSFPIHIFKKFFTSVYFSRMLALALCTIIYTISYLTSPLLVGILIVCSFCYFKQLFKLKVFHFFNYFLRNYWVKYKCIFLVLFICFIKLSSREAILYYFWTSLIGENIIFEHYVCWTLVFLHFWIACVFFFSSFLKWNFHVFSNWALKFVILRTFLPMSVIYAAYIFSSLLLCMLFFKLSVFKS